MIFREPGLIIILTSAFISATGKIEFYKGEYKSSFDCNNVDLKEPFSCVCLSAGLWKVYVSCTEFYFIGVKNKHCFSPREMIRRVERLPTQNTQFVVTGYKRTIEYKGQSSILLEEEDVILAQRPTTISDGLVSYCLVEDKEIAEPTEQFCHYEVSDLLSSIRIVQDGCAPDSMEISPSECHELIEDRPICQNFFEPQSHTRSHRRIKRMLPPHAVNKTPFADTMEPDDEDFWNPAAAKDELAYGIVVGPGEDDGKYLENPIVSAEIWNYLDQQLDEVLELGPFPLPQPVTVPPIGGEDPLPPRPPPPPPRDPDYSIFKILEITKNVFLKTCPPFYVKPEFVNVAVEAFTSILLKRNYLNEFHTTFEGVNRLIQALKLCHENVTMFPFIDESAHDPCDKSHTKAPVGAYKLLGNTSEIVVPVDFLSWKNEPLIDTTWKIFVNAYLYCFNFFDTTYDDLFRYATIMEALFQGEIYKIWMSGKTPGKMFGGFLGNVRDATDNVTYCMATAALETDFPWSIRRPPKDQNDFFLLKRRKREAGIRKYEGAADCYENEPCSELDFIP